MKRTINVFTIIVIIFSLFLVISRCSLRIAAPVTSPESAEKVVNAFADFPLDKQKFIDIEADEDTFNNFTQREQKDKVLDWLLYTTVYSSGIKAETLSDILYDLPTIRYGYMHPVANFEFGDTRSCVIGDKSIIALIPRDIEENRYKDYLAGIADNHRKDLGEEPKIIHLFRYKIDLKERYALLKRCPDVNAGALFTEEYGYYTATVKNLDDFKRFMEKIEDITYVEVAGEGLKLGGRKLKEHYRGIRVEDVAAIRQAEKEIQDRQKKFDAKWQHNLDLLNEKLEEYNRRQMNYYHELGPDRFDKDMIMIGNTDKVLGLAHPLQKDSQGYHPPYKITSSVHYDQEYKKLIQMMQEDFIKEQIPAGIGFSLDHIFDFKGLQKDFSDPERIFKAISSLEPTLIKKEEIQKAVDALRDNNIVPLLVIADKLIKSDNDRAKFFGEILDAAVQYHRFQKARYDGPLQGTEVGMVLFYTDLLAKLWALDYQSSIPGKDVENFIPLIATRVSPIYKQESLELTDTRLWFGTNDKGFQKIGYSDRLLFARVAARVYAASSNPLQPGKEAAPNAESAAFLGWWNDHYEEIARYEPEYERLNEIMKWSILIAWLNDANKGHYLDFLQNVKVYKSNWFKNWVKSRQNLKFKKWDKVEFYKPGYLGSDTEAMAILYSREYEHFGQQRTLCGGVSLAPRNLFKMRSPLSSKIISPLRRSGLNYSKTTIKGNLKILQTLDGPSFNLKNLTPTRVSVTGIAKEGVKLRSLYSEIKPQKIEQIFSLKTRGLEIETRIGENQLGRLRISSSKNGFNVGWKSRNIDTGHSLARKLSMVEKPGDVLLKEPGIASIIQQGEDQFVIKFKNSETWLKMAPEKVPSSVIQRGFQSRVSDIERGIKNYQLKWFEPSALQSELRYGNSEYIILRPLENTGKEMIVVNPTRGPPTGSKPFEIDYGHFKIKGRLDPAKGEIFIEQGSIPKNLRGTPDKLQKVLKNDIPIILEKAKRPGGMIRYKGTNSLDLDSDTVVTYLRNKDYGKAAKEIVQNPRQLKSSLRDHLRGELLRNKKFQEAGHYSKAGHHIDELIDIHGPRPELKIHKGLIELKRNRYIEAKNQFNDVLSQSNVTNREQFLREINSHMENSSMKFGFDKIKNESCLEYFLDKSFNGRLIKEAEIGNIIKSKPSIYIQDTPSLTNLDWSPATRTGNLAQAIRGRRVFKLMNTDIDKMKPGILHVPGKLVNLHPSSPYRFIRYYPDDDDDEMERRGEIYLIFAEK